MTGYHKDILNKLLFNLKPEQILNLSIQQVEKAIDEGISKRTYDIILDYIEEQLIDDEFVEIMSLYEAGKSFTEVLDTIVSAIKNRWYLAVFYEDEDGRHGFRLVEPYVVGKGYRFRGVISKDHKDDYYLRCYIIKDAKKDPSVGFDRKKSYSYSREEPYWRTLRLDRIISIYQIKRKIRWYRKEYTGGTDKNIVERLQWVDKSEFRGVNPY